MLDLFKQVNDRVVGAVFRVEELNLHDVYTYVVAKLKQIGGADGLA